MQERESCFPIFKELNIFILLILNTYFFIGVRLKGPRMSTEAYCAHTYFSLIYSISVMEVLGSLKFKTGNSWLSYLRKMHGRKVANKVVNSISRHNNIKVKIFNRELRL